MFLQINAILWHARIGHYSNKNNQNFIIEHLKNHNSKNCNQCNKKK